MWCTGLAAPRHVGSSRTRTRTCVPCIGRRILNHCATREVPIIIFLNKFIYLFLAALGLCCCTRAFSSCGEWGLLFVAVRVLLLLQSMGSRSAGSSVVVVHGFSCSAACGIFLDQGLNPCPPALAGGFLTAAPPGKSRKVIFKSHSLLKHYDCPQ